MSTTRATARPLSPTGAHEPRVARPPGTEQGGELIATRAGAASLWHREWKPLLAMGAAFLLLYHFPTSLLPAGGARPVVALGEGALLAREYARAHVVLCLLPAFLIAGGISVFVSQGSVIRHLGADANRVVAYGAGVWHLIYSARWIITAGLAVVVGIMLVAWLGLAAWRVAAVGAVAVATALLFADQPLIPFGVAALGVAAIAGREVESTAGEWMEASWRFAKQILPLLLVGVLVAGALLGRPGHEGIVPVSWIAGSVGGESLPAVLVAAVAGAFMYFATLTEVPILQGLIGAGMGAGAALALLLAGPALSLPNMLVIRSVIGTRKTVVYVAAGGRDVDGRGIGVWAAGGYGAVNHVSGPSGLSG